MQERLSSPMTAASIAREVCLSRSHFGKLFREQVGGAPYQYLKAARLERAKRLLIETELSVKETAAAVGLPDVSHFVRDFEKAYGKSPIRVRRSRGEKSNIANILFL